jgi:hypothetical protein
LECKIEPRQNPEVVTQEKLVVYFFGEKKRLVCNSANFDAISLLTCEGDTDMWLGHRVCMFAKVEPVRVRAPNAQSTRQKKAATPPRSTSSSDGEFETPSDLGLPSYDAEIPSDGNEG